MHVLVPYAVSDDPAARAAVQGVQLPRLQALLQALRPQPALALPAHSAVSAHEHLLAAAQGLDPRAPAWAARRAQALGLPGAEQTAWAFVSPSHWELGQARVTLRDPQALDLREDESRALLAAMQPFFAEDGITLHYEQPLRWLAQGDVFQGLVTASPERVLGRDVAPWLPASPLLRRLQNEMQMLLYTHAVTEARAQRRALPVNSFWLSGTGVLPASSPAAAMPQVLAGLTAPAIQGDWAAWAQAWQTLDAQLAPLIAAHRAGTRVTLTLCGELAAQHWRAAPSGLWDRLRRQLRPPQLSAILVAT